LEIGTKVLARKQESPGDEHTPYVWLCASTQCQEYSSVL
jgi:hypothetical protein